MDYLQQLQWRGALQQMKLRVLADLRDYLESADSLELTQFARELALVELQQGASLHQLLSHIVSTGAPPAGWAPSRLPLSLGGPPVFAVPAGAAALSAAGPVMSAPAGAPPAESPGREIPAPAPEVPPVEPPDAGAARAAGPAPGKPAPAARAAASGGATPEAMKKEALSEAEKAMKLIPGGSFLMGSKEGKPEEQPAHTVALAPFRISARLVTCREYRQFVRANPQWSKGDCDPELHDGRYLSDWEGADYPEGKDENPVCQIPFEAARAYAAWLGKRLPTEAEWEFAARGGAEDARFPGGDSIDEKKANFAKRMGGTTPVGAYPANGYGLFDMAGNVFEWVSDWYGKYPPGKQKDPKGPAEAETRVIRGGSWISGADALRVRFRADEDPRCCGYIGFRLAE
jgi:formylglycine-generating enzyme required for sulfatase activity